MSSLADVLYPLPALRRTPIAVIGWWESRRLLYNKIVGSAGLVTLAGVTLLMPRVFDGWMTLVPVLAYGVLANICYSFGWAAELVARAVWGSRAPDLGPLLFREGLIFSVGLTLFPLVLTLLFQMMRLVLLIVG
jgi:hypothetical protein